MMEASRTRSAPFSAYTVEICGFSICHAAGTKAGNSDITLIANGTHGIRRVNRMSS